MVLSSTNPSWGHAICMIHKAIRLFGATIKTTAKPKTTIATKEIRHILQQFLLPIVMFFYKSFSFSKQEHRLETNFNGKINKISFN
jgi:hypothetical protein